MQHNSQSFKNIKQIVENDVWATLAVPDHSIYTGGTLTTTHDYKEKKYTTKITKKRIDACIDAIEKVITVIIAKNKKEEALELAARLKQAKSLLENMQKIIEETAAAKTTKKEISVPLKKWSEYSTYPTYTTAWEGGPVSTTTDLPIELPNQCKGKITPTRPNE